MGAHTKSPTGRPEPVAILDTCKAAVAALVATGWVTVDDTTVNLIGTAIGLVVYVVLVVVTRGQVTPLSDPVDVDGTDLVPLEPPGGSG